MKIKEQLGAVEVIYGDLKNLKLQYAIKDIIYRIMTRERMMSYGELNANKTFYVIRSMDFNSPFYIGPIHHLLANYFYVLSHLIYANEKGFISIVDQKNYPVYNKADCYINGTDNPWEYYWEQPSTYTLDEVYNSKKVVLSKQGWKQEWNIGYDISKHKDESIINMLHDAMEMVPLKHEIENYCIEQIRECLSNEGDVIGVSYRFLGYSLNSPMPANGHPIQLQPEELLTIAEQKLDEWNANYVFLSSDEEEAVKIFRKRLGHRLVCMDRLRRLASEKLPIGEKPVMYNQKNIYKTSLDYLSEMEALSKCDMLLGSISTGLRYAIVRNNFKYKNVEILDNGLICDHRLKTRRQR